MIGDVGDLSEVRKAISLISKGNRRILDLSASPMKVPVTDMIEFGRGSRRLAKRLLFLGKIHARAAERISPDTKRETSRLKSRSAVCLPDYGKSVNGRIKESGKGQLLTDPLTVTIGGIALVSLGTSDNCATQTS